METVEIVNGLAEMEAWEEDNNAHELAAVDGHEELTGTQRREVLRRGLRRGIEDNREFGVTTPQSRVTTAPFRSTELKD